MYRRWGGGSQGLIWSKSFWNSKTRSWYREWMCLTFGCLLLLALTYMYIWYGCYCKRPTQYIVIIIIHSWPLTSLTSTNMKSCSYVYYSCSFLHISKRIILEIEQVNIATLFLDGRYHFHYCLCTMFLWTGLFGLYYWQWWFRRHLVGSEGGSVRKGMKKIFTIWGMTSTALSLQAWGFVCTYR